VTAEDEALFAADDRSTPAQFPAGMNWRHHISAEPAVLVGKPVIHGTRLADEFVLGVIAAACGKPCFCFASLTCPSLRPSRESAIS